MNVFNYLLESFKWLSKKSIAKFVWIPLFINIVLFVFAGWGLMHYFEQLMNRFLPADSWLSYLSFILWPLFAIMILIVFFYTFSLIANIIASPFNAFLSEKVELLETGVQPESGRALHLEIILSVTQEIGKTLFFIMWAIPVLIISFIPVINVIAPLLWFIYAAWSAYLQYMDYPMGNNGLLFAQQRKILAKQKTNTIVFGGFITILLMIPFINLLVMPLGVIAATLHWCRDLKPKL